MVEDLVISTYKEQIKESLLKAKAIETAGFSIIISELERRGIDTVEVNNFFNRIKNCVRKEELDKISVIDLDRVISSINKEITKALISPIDISDILIRKSRTIANEMSVDGKILDDDSFIKIGTNLANDINMHGIAHGLDTCIKNYTIQKVYQATYQEKIDEKEKELGLTNDVEEKDEQVVKKHIQNTNKSRLMNEIFSKNISDIDEEFSVIKNNYLNYIMNKVNKLEEFK